MTLTILDLTSNEEHTLEPTDLVAYRGAPGTRFDSTDPVALDGINACDGTPVVEFMEECRELCELGGYLWVLDAGQDVWWLSKIL